MRYILFFGILLFSFANNTSAQFVELSYRTGFSNYFNQFVRGSNGEFVVGSYDTGFSTIATIYNVSADSVIWQSGYSNIIFDAFLNSQGNIVLITAGNGCDVETTEDIRRYEIVPNGQVIANSQMPYLIYGGWQYETRSYPSHLYVFWNTILKLDNDGIIIYETEYVANVDDFNDLIETSDGKLLAFSSSGFLAIFNEEGTFVDTLQLPEEILRAERSLYGDIFLVSNTAIYTLDTAFSIQDISTPLGLTDNITDLAVDSFGVFLLSENGFAYHIDTSYALAAQVNLSSYMEAERVWPTDSGIYCSGVNGNAGVIVRLGSDLAVLSDVTVEWMRVSELQVFNGEVRIVGEEDHFPHQYNHPSALLKNFDTQLNTGNWENDVALVDIAIDSVGHSYNPGGGSSNRTEVYPMIRISNSGTNVIQDVEVSYHFSPVQPWICELMQLRVRLSEINLSPMEDTIVYLPRIPWFSYSNVGPTNLIICAYVYNPNEKMDMDHSNNKVCSTFNVNVSVNEMEAAGFNVYPNPVADRLIVKTNGLIGSTAVTVTDMVGRVIPFDHVTTENRLIIDTGNWHAGVYLLTIYNGNVRYDRKVVKQ